MGTISKALELLNFYSRDTPSMGLSEVVRRSGRDKATVHRHLTELMANGFIAQDPVSREYRLGPAILRLAAVREATAPTRTLVQPIVEALAEEVGELVHFSLLEGTRLSPTCHFDPRVHGTQVHFDEAEVLPLHATSSGLAVLAFGPDTLAQTVLSGPLDSYTAKTETSPEALAAYIEATARDGVAFVEKAFDTEVCSLAAPIFDANGQVLGALAIAVPASRATPASETRHAEALRRGQQRVTDALGGAIPPSFPS